MSDGWKPTASALLSLGAMALSLAGFGARAAPGDDPPPVGRRLALVVGTGVYRHSSWSPLANVAVDASTLARELREGYGYDVKELEDPTRAEFKQALSEIARIAEPHDDLLVYVGGHGYFDTTDNSGHLVLADGDATCESGCYPLDHISRSLYATRALHVLVMLDACYAGTIDPRVAVAGSAGESWRAAPPPADQVAFLDDYARYPSRLIFTSVGREAASDGRPGFHSPFMTNVLARLARPGPGGIVSIDQIFLQFQDASGGLRGGVMRPSPMASQRAHHPQGTYLFAQQLDFCSAVKTITAGRDVDFDSLRTGDSKVLEWGVVTRSRWTLPGAKACYVWRWAQDDQPQVQCDLGQYTHELANERLERIQQRITACMSEVAWQAASRDTVEEGARMMTRAIKDPSTGRRISVSATCGVACAVSVTFD
jgi:hypothetical protein